MSDSARAAVIQEHCKELKLAAVVRDHPALCRQARDGKWACQDLLRELLEAEVTNRRQSTARWLLREARFPEVKPFKANAPMTLKFEVKDKTGAASSNLEPYKGMAVHAEIIRDDLSVFAHIHPSVRHRWPRC